MEPCLRVTTGSCFPLTFALSISCGQWKNTPFSLSLPLLLLSLPPFPSLLFNSPMAINPTNLTSHFTPTFPRNYQITPTSIPPLKPTFPRSIFASLTENYPCFLPPSSRKIACKASEISVAEESPASGNWVPVVPVTALPRGERRVILQGGETILLLWYKDKIFAIENKSPAEGAYTEGLINAKLTQDGCIVCPTTDSTFDLQTGEIKEWYPKNPVLRILTPALRKLFIYPVKTDEENIYINMRGNAISDLSAEIVFSGKAQPGVTASDVNVDEVRMVIDEDLEGFGFSGKNEVINGKAAVIGFLLLLDFELLTGKGLLKGTGFLDFIYSISKAFN